MRVPASSRARNAPSQSRPKWMLWCSVPVGSAPRTPACHTSAEGEKRPRRATRGASNPGRSVRYATGRSALQTTVSARRTRPSSSRTPRTGPWLPRSSRMRSTRVSYQNAAPAFSAARASADRQRVHPAFGHEHAVHRVHVCDHGVERERLVRREPGVHGLEAEDALQALVVEEAADDLRQLAERTEADELERRRQR